MRCSRVILAASQKKESKEAPRWSFVLQDLPQRAQKLYDDVDKGYLARVATVFAVAGTVLWGAYQYICYRQRDFPIAKRWSWITPPVPIRLIERRRIGDSKLEVFRFALPSPVDYTGYDPISSVQVISGDIRGHGSITRWFTPVSHPQERGIVEFVIKDQDPGAMAGRLRYLRVGDTVHLGRWMKEFPYRPNERRELGLICSVGGSSVALQLLTVMARNPQDKTKLSVIHCNSNALLIPEELFAPYVTKDPLRFRVVYTAQQVKGCSREELKRRRIFAGHVDEDLVRTYIPPPVCVSNDADNAGGGLAEESRILVCGHQQLMKAVCGRSTPVFNITYIQGLFYKYGGLLKDLGFQRKQVYKFGVSTHPIAFH